MRLINTSTLELEEFTGDFPKYAILSHTWGDEEVSFQLFQTPQRQSRASFTKIKQFCALAARQNLEYAWVDTCCIDKSSSAELSEAINSMYSWYEKSECCMVYLSDMHRCLTIIDEFERSEAEYKVFQACRWFRRGWCLQELLAPESVIFYDQDWNKMGTRFSMAQLISRESRIKASHLIDPELASVAQKMSWAAHRQTTRTEDEAYCLLGLFGVNMPLLYGEGSNAFKRLQQEIIKSSNDESIFAWTNQKLWFSGLLANHPRDFADSGDIIQSNDTDLSRAPYMMTNQGLQIELAALESARQKAGRFESPLRCTREGLGKDTLITLLLTRLDEKKSIIRVMRTGLSNKKLKQATVSGLSTGSMLCYVDEIKCDKRRCETDTDLIWSYRGRSLNLGLRLLNRIGIVYDSQIYPIDNRRVGFYIVDADPFKISDQCHDDARFCVCWPRKASSPTSINIYCLYRDQETERNVQWKDATKREDWNSMSVEAGSSLTTWFGSDLYLFIALNPDTTPSQTRTIIDIELRRIPPGDPLYEKIVLSDPRRNDPGYRDSVGGWDAEQHYLEETFSGGNGLYGVSVPSIESRSRWMRHEFMLETKAQASFS